MMNFIKNTWVLCIASLFAVSCENDSLMLQHDGTGVLVLDNVSVDLSVEDGSALKTKGTFVAPDKNELTFTLTNEDNNKQLVQKGMPDKLVLEQGRYTLSASYGTEEMGTTPYLYGSCEFEIRLEETTVLDDFTVSLNCAIVRANVSEELISQYKPGYSLTLSDGTSQLTINNDEDIFVPVGKNYELKFEGENLINENNSFSFQLNDPAKKTRYTINCNPDLPSFTIPAQPNINAWSRRIYITPLTEQNIVTDKEGLAAKILQNVKYEASADGVVWTEAVSENNHWVIKGLQPNTQYTLRAKFGGVISTNQQQLTTLGEPQLPNNTMENWTSTKLSSGNGTWSRDMYCDYCTDWGTRNERTTLGAEDANSGGIFGTLKGNGYGVYWRWYSGTRATTDAVSGNAAEISTLAFYNEKVSGGWKRESVYNYTRDNGTAYAGYLFTGTFDKNNDTYNLGISHNVRPSSVSFDYKYAPIDTDQCIAYAKVYDANKNVIAETQVFNSSAQESYKTQKMDLVYKNLFVEAAYIAVFFQSGTILDIAKMNHVQGGYSASPFNEDRIVGSVLKVDNIVLNYE